MSGHPRTEGSATSDVAENAPAESETRLRAIVERMHEVERQRMQQLELDDRFLSHASHELRSPLSSVYEFLTLLRDGIGGELSTEHEKYVEIMLRNVCDLRGMIGDLMEVARARNGKLVVTPRRLQLAGYLEGLIPILTSLLDPRRLRLESRFDSDLPAVVGDPNRIRQVLVNLIENAVRHSPEESSIALVVERCPGEPAFVRFTVADQGRGIPLGELDHVFEYMHQPEQHQGMARHGLGLSLYVCRELVTLQGGRIWAETVPGQGATIRFSLPVFPVSEGEASCRDFGAHS
jgi:signal transduction histidine kinase